MFFVQSVLSETIETQMSRLVKGTTKLNSPIQ